jgi:hypothetical protein
MGLFSTFEPAGTSARPSGMDQIEPSPMSRSRASFEGAAEAHFKWDGDFWQRAVAQAAAQYPDFLETTYRDARNNLAYCMK